MTDSRYAVIPLPSKFDEWAGRIPDMRATLWRYLGDLPESSIPDVTVTERRERDGYVCEKIRFDNRAEATVYGYVLIPDGLTGRAPAILYHHMHGGKYHIGKEELFQGWLTGTEPGPALVKAGFVVLAIDAYGFGERWHQGPLGVGEFGVNTELALFKKFVWEGSTLWGMMVRDDLMALEYLLSRPEIDPQRVGTTGMSLGASRTTWLGALDERLKVIVPVAQMTRYRDFAASGQYNLHGIYYYLPGMFKSGMDMEHVSSLSAPRHQCILIGDSDALSPLVGIEAVVAYTREVYRLYGNDDHFEAHLYPGIAHKYTPEMFAYMVEYFRRTL